MLHSPAPEAAEEPEGACPAERPSPSRQSPRRAAEMPEATDAEPVPAAQGAAPAKATKPAER